MSTQDQVVASRVEDRIRACAARAAAAAPPLKPEQRECIAAILWIGEDAA